MRANIGNTDSFVVKQCNAIVVFRSELHSDMMGETIISFTACLMEYDGNGKFTTTESEMSYEQLKWCYRDVLGKDLRMKYWGWMKEFAPAMVQERRDDHRAQSIAAVI